MTLVLDSASLVNIAGRGRPGDSRQHDATITEVVFGGMTDVAPNPLWRSTSTRVEVATAVDVGSYGSTHFASRAENTNVVDSTEGIGQNTAPNWGSPSGTVFDLKQGETLDLSFGLRFTDPNSDPMTITHIAGELPVGVTFDPITHMLVAALDAPVGLHPEDLVFRADDSQVTVRNVGPGKPYTTVRAAILAAGNGDTIQIDPGDYLGDVATITAHNLLIKGTSPINRARLFANGVHQSDKGLLVLEGDDCTFENMEFHQVAGPSQNLAGVRHDGAGLTTFRNCGFFDNENGILSGGGGEVLMEFCEFARNGFGDGQTHNVYFGTHPKVTARDCYFHEAHIGHEFKSRAKENILERCYIVNGNSASGDASYLVNADNGGRLIMRGCMLHKGVNADNSNSIFHNNNIWGASFNSILLEHCTLVHEYPSGSFINLSSGTVGVTLTACLFASNGRPLVTGATPVQNSNFHTTVNKIPNASNIADPDFWPDISIYNDLDLPAPLVPTYLIDEPQIFQPRNLLSPPTVIGSIQNTLTSSTVDYWAMPSLQDEINFYANTNKPGGAWAWTVADQTFTFASTPVPLPNFAQTGSNKRDIHDDFENDDLWIWQSQINRGYTNPSLITNATQRTIPTLWRDRWLQYYQQTFLEFGLKVNDTFGDDSGNNGHYCHTFGTGLCLHAATYGDATSLAAAQAIADYLLDPATLRNSRIQNMAVVGTAASAAHERTYGRFARLLCDLVELTGLQKYIDARNKCIERFVNATDWMEAPAMGMYPGTGFYHTGGADTGHGLDQAEYDAGYRQVEGIFLPLHADFLWCAYLQTGRADVKDRLIKLGRFCQHYAFDPAHTIPMVGQRFGHFNGAIWHPLADGVGWSGVSFGVINAQVFAYKLTGDTTLLDSAKYAFRQCSKFEEGYPYYYGVQNNNTWPTLGTGSHVPDNEVWDFVDTVTHTGSGSFLFTWDKGVLPKCHAIFENGGNPTVIL